MRMLVNHAQESARGITWPKASAPAPLHGAVSAVVARLPMAYMHTLKPLDLKWALMGAAVGKQTTPRLHTYLPTGEALPWPSDGAGLQPIRHVRHYSPCKNAAQARCTSCILRHGAATRLDVQSDGIARANTARTLVIAVLGALSCS